MKKIIEKWYIRLNFPQKFDEQFYNILKTEEIDENMTIEEYDKTSKNGRKNLLMYLYFLENTEKRYIENNISLKVFEETVQDIVRWTKTWSDIKGELWLGELEWLSFHLSLKLFKIGRLQYEMMEINEDIAEYGVVKGDSILSVHIPPTGPLDYKECERSFVDAERFFKTYFPDFKYKIFICHSWLLDNTLSKYLKPDSNILRFQSLFKPIKSRESYSLLKYIFGWDAGVEKLPGITAKTTFAENVKQAVLNGEKFYLTWGVKKANE